MSSAIAVSVAVAMSVTASTLGTSTAEVTPPLGPPPAESFAPGSSAGDPGASLRPVRTGSTASQPGIDLGSTTSPVSPGLNLTEFERLDAGGWARGDVLTADLSQPALKPEYLHAGAASERTPLSEQAARKGAVAGVNGDFFDLDGTGAPLGVGVDHGEALNLPGRGHHQAAAVSGGSQPVGRLMEVLLDAKLTRADGSVLAASDLNAPKVSPGGIAVYTPFWGDASRATAVDGARRITEVEVINGVVAQVSGTPVEGPIPAGAVRLLGTDAGADALSTMRPGDRVGVEYRPKADGVIPQMAIGGNKVLLRDGQVQPLDDTALHPRTAVGFSADGKRMWLITVDGRQADSSGMTERELAEHLKSLGADDAINLDGGGSSTLLARKEGENAARVHNSPSDGDERAVPNGVGFSAAPGSGRLTGFRVEPAGAHGDRVLSGLTRHVNAFGHDETGAAVPANPKWTVNPGSGGYVEADSGTGVFHAAQPARTRVSATENGVSGETGLNVLGPPARIRTDTDQVRLPGIGSRGRFQVFGHDAGGFGTWVEPDDVRLEYDPNVLRISPDGDGFAVTSLVPDAAAPVTVKVGDQVTHVGVAVGAHPQQLSPVDGSAGWHPSVHPATVRAALTDGPGHAGTPGLDLSYSLTGTTAPRAAQVNADQPLPLPAGAQRLGVWVNGDGRGGRLRYTVADSSGMELTVDLARKVDWTGWRYVAGALPTGVAGPLRLRRLYVSESDPAKQYDGRLSFDDLTVTVPPAVELPRDPQPPDRSVVQDGSLPPGQGGNRVAVVSDAGFTSDDPDGPRVRAARRSLREALAAHPDMVVINGDFVGRGTAADFDLARQVIESEIGGKVAWQYVPGNHEADGPGNLGEFAAEFGKPAKVVDSNGQRMVFLDSALGSLRAGGLDQIVMLRRALDGAAADPSISSVAVFLHHPVDDPTPGRSAELTDPKEAALLTGWLAGFQQASGKPAASVAAHAGRFDASTVDGVPHLVNGAAAGAGTASAGATADGGFEGSSLLRLAPHDRDRVRWETRPFVDDLRLRVPDQVEPGQQLPVTSELVQGDRVVPVGYPVSADWWGSPEVHIGPPWQARAGEIAAFDPATGVLTGLRPGSGELGVTVNGVTRKAHFLVT